MLLSIIIPVYNEEKTLKKIVDAVEEVRLDGLDKELILIDDGSTDHSSEVIKQLTDTYLNIRSFSHLHNQGKGAAVRKGFQEANGDIILIQDADMEYDPNDYSVLIGPILDGRADVVYGSRFITAKSHRVLYFWHSVGNRFITLLCNMITDLNLTDMETCYKAFKKEVVQKITIRENRFGLEPEITAKISRISPKLRIFEVGISYFGRTYEEGKKIGWKDGVWALFCIIRYRFFN
jgi:glycosyltransferase involved in cell wall biosynthesis